MAMFLISRLAVTVATTMPFPARLKTELQIDSVLLTIVLALLLGGFVILASASISISENAVGNPFFYIQRQLLAAAIGAIGIQAVQQGGVNVGYTITGWGKDGTAGPNNNGTILILTSGQ